MAVISIRPDPAHPRGGYAEVSLPEDGLAGAETAQIAVFDNYSERYLGDTGWQATRVMFGPYEVHREGGQARFVIGPEIVNRIEEYANVKLDVGGAATDIAWPDEVVPAPGAAKIGGIMSAAAREKPAESTLKAKVEEPAPAPEPEPAPPEPETAPPAPAKSGLGTFIVGLIVVLLGGAALAYWLFYMQDDVEEAVTRTVEPAAPVAANPDPCGRDRLAGLDGFSAQAAALRACGAKAEADTALGLVERAAAAGNAEALSLFGTVYDGAADAPVFENDIGLTFGDVPATAAEYYARAVEAGSDDAAEKLEALCVRMIDMTDTLAQGAVADYCNN